MTERQKEYQKYLQSDHWKSLRLQALTRDGFKCTSCGSFNNLQGHHIRYRPDWYSGVVEDIQTLCDSCHLEAHQKRRKKRHRKRNKRPQIVQPSPPKPPRKTQCELASQPWFLEALEHNRHTFMGIMRHRFATHPRRNSMLSNAAMLYDYRGRLAKVLKFNAKQALAPKRLSPAPNSGQSHVPATSQAFAAAPW